MNEALQQLEPLVGDWDVTLTHAWFLDSLDTEIRAPRPFVRRRPVARWSLDDIIAPQRRPASSAVAHPAAGTPSGSARFGD